MEINQITEKVIDTTIEIHILPIHEAQLLTYLKMMNKKVGLLINFNVSVLKNGIKRMVNKF